MQSGGPGRAVLSILGTKLGRPNRHRGRPHDRPDFEFALDIGAKHGVVSAAGALTNGGGGDLDFGVRTYEASP